MKILSYAQNREDVLLHRAFIDRTNGFYIDVGACHPISHSVTKLAYDRGWSGINIEPMPGMFQMLCRGRPRDINLHMGLSNREGASTFYEVPAMMGYSTFSPAQAEDLRRNGFILDEHSIPITTLSQVCEKYVRQTIDFLKIDVESSEREVLEGGDWHRFRPRVVLVEATLPGSNTPCHDRWENLLLEAHYLFAFFDGLNRYYVREEDRDLLPVLGVPANVFDDFEPYEYHQPIQEIRQVLEATRRSSLSDSQSVLAVARDELEGTHRALEECRAALGASQNALEEYRGTLQAMQSQLASTQARLEIIRARLAPFEDWGPMTIAVGRRLRRLSAHFPKLASLVKRIVRAIHPHVRVLVSLFMMKNRPAKASSYPGS